MKENRTAAIFVGAFYIAATVAGIISLAIQGSTLAEANFLNLIAADNYPILLSSLFMLIMAISVAGVAIAAYPVLKKYNPGIALGYAGIRLAEGLVYIAGVISLLLLIPLSREFAAAGSPADSYFHTLGRLLIEVRDWGAHLVLDVVVFPLSALLFYALLFRVKLVPRWLSGWGLIAAGLYLLAGVMVMFDLTAPQSPLQVGLNIPLALQEMVLAVWLIAKGFRPVPSTREEAA